MTRRGGGNLADAGAAPERVAMELLAPAQP
jgi:hypothetical protein